MSSVCMQTDLHRHCNYHLRHMSYQFSLHQQGRDRLMTERVSALGPMITRSWPSHVLSILFLLTATTSIDDMVLENIGLGL
jgi:hypothetical protein